MKRNEFGNEFNRYIIVRCEHYPDLISWWKSFLVNAHRYDIQGESVERGDCVFCFSTPKNSLYRRVTLLLITNTFLDSSFFRSLFLYL